MAGETPGADAARRADRRRRLSPSGGSANKYYASGSPSVLGEQSAADSRQKPGEQPKPIGTPRFRQDDRSTDKYYRDKNLPKGPKAPAAVPASRPRRPLGPPPTRLGTVKVPRTNEQGVVVTSLEEARAAVDEVRNRLVNGENAVFVFFPEGKEGSRLLRRVRAGVEMLVTREEISEDQGRDVQYRYLVGGAPPPGHGAGAAPTTAAGTPTVTKEANQEDADLAHVDPLAFLANPPPEETVDTTPQDRQEVTPTGDGGLEVTKIPDDAPPEDDFGADNSFLDAQPPAEPVPEPAAVEVDEPAAGAEAPPETRQNRKSRRSGRGT
jgi:hypothetical protein